MSKTPAQNDTIGTIDPSFVSGLRIEESYAVQLLTLPDDTLIVGITSYGPSSRVAKLSKDGALDTNFGNNGIREILLRDAYPAVITGLHHLSGNKLLVLVSALVQTEHGSLYVPAAVRLNADGSMDQSFGENGAMVYKLIPGIPDQRRIANNTPSGSGSLGAATDRYQNVTDYGGYLQLPDGGAFIAAEVYVETNRNYSAYLMKVTADGHLDETFLGEGFVELDPDFHWFPTGLCFADSAHDSFIISGVREWGQGFVAKFDLEARVDRSFGMGGYYTYRNVPFGDMQCGRLIPLEKERFLVCGSIGSTDSSAPGTSVISVLDRTGKVDPNFNTGSPVLIQAGSDSVTLFADVLLDNKHRLVVCGRHMAPTGDVPNRVISGICGRYDSDSAAPDTHFGNEDGLKFLKPMNWLNAAATQSDGKYIFAGTTQDYERTVIRVFSE